MRSLEILILSILCLFSKAAPAQILETRVSFSYHNIRLASALADLRTKYHVGFSYANNLIPLDKKVTATVKDKPLGQALNDLFQETGVTYALVGQQIVLKRGAVRPAKSKALKKQPVPNKTGASLNPGPSEAEPATETSSSDAGQELTASLLPRPVLSLENNEGKPVTREELRKDFKTEERNLEKNYMSQMDVAMDFQDTALSSQLKKEYRRLKTSLKKEYDDVVNQLENVKWDSLFVLPASDSARNTNPVQVSFVPPLSTNGRNNEFSVNQYSYNVLVGYAGGLNGVEVGGIANIENGSAKGVQVAGITNVVRKDVNGVQVAGVLNLGDAHLGGVQVAGFLNVSRSDSSSAVQVGGFSNVHRGDLVGTQVAGFLNVNGGYMIGPQVAGFLNVAQGPVAGVQVAGFMNTNAGNMRGVQVAGFMNDVQKNTIGSQIAGFMNVNQGNIQGVQVAGFLNRARKVQGSQIGVINFADSVSGVQIGIFNFCKSGYRRLEFFTAERMKGNVAFKMGTKKFYNIFAAGIQSDLPKAAWSYGFGVGSEFRLGNHFDMNLDLVCNQVQENTKAWTENLNLLNQFKVHFSYHPRRRTSLFAGPTLNVAVSRVKNSESGLIGSSLIPDWAQYDKTNNQTRVAIWPGFNAGIRF